MKCPTCGKELYDNGEDRFNCPFCGVEVVGGEFAAKETTEERLHRMERELARQKVKSEIEEQSAFEHFWFRIANPFSMLDRQAAREALERRDLEAAKRHLANAEKSFSVGCILYVIVIAVILLVVAFAV